MFIRPKISIQEAENLFSAKRSAFPLVSKLMAKKNKISPEKLEIIYLPFYLFEVLVEKKSKGERDGNSRKQKVTLSVDGLLGHAVFYAKDDMNEDNNQAAPFCQFELLPAAARRIALSEYKGILLEHGLRTRSHSQAEEISESRKIFYPFWMCYYRKRKGFDFQALDALSGEIQGIKMRKLFFKVIREMF